MKNYNNEITMNEVSSNYDASEYGVEFNALAYAYFNRHTENSIEEMNFAFEEKNLTEVRKHSNIIENYTEKMEEIKYEIETSHPDDVARFEELTESIECEYDISQLGESTELNLFEDEDLKELLVAPNYPLYEVFGNYYLKKSDAEYISTNYGETDNEVKEVKMTVEGLMNIDIYAIIGDMQIVVDVRSIVSLELASKTFR